MYPDVTGTYEDYGYFNDEVYYKNTTKEFYLWWHSLSSRWYLSAEMGDPNDFFHSYTSLITGSYNTSGEYAGMPHVARL